MKIHTAVFEIQRPKDFLPKIKKTYVKCTILNILKIKKHLSNTVFAYVIFQKASFNSNRDMRQIVGLDGGYSDGPQNNTSRRFQKRAGGKNWKG